MICYPVYLELDAQGHCMAHILDPPGCAVRAPNREAALRELPDALRACYAWLRQHGEPVPGDDEPITLEVVEQNTGIGPFDPGDAAALFSPEREPLTDEALRRFIRLLGYSRADLLALVRDLPDGVLDWQPAPDAFSIRRLLRHVGNAEQWYVSRLVPPETLPPEWNHDEQLPILEFLEMERRTALARLRQLTPSERAQVSYPTRWTDHPDEAWTARKALRRFLEHEREHTAQIQKILAAWRAARSVAGER